jgi:hypothetical protein
MRQLEERRAVPLQVLAVSGQPLVVSVTLPRFPFAITGSPFATGDRGFESCSLQRRVQCEPGFVARTDLPLRRPTRFPSRSLMRPARLCRGYGGGSDAGDRASRRGSRANGSRAIPTGHPRPRLKTMAARKRRKISSSYLRRRLRNMLTSILGARMKS